MPAPTNTPPKQTKTGRTKKKPGPAKKAQRFAQKVQLQERRRKALDMRSNGLPWAAIVQALGYYDEAHCRKDLAVALKEITLPTSEEYKKLQLRTLERYQIVTDAGIVLPTQAKPALSENEHKLNLLRVRSGIRVQERIAKLMGLDAPIQVNHGGQVNVSQLDDAQLAAAASGRPIPPPKQISNGTKNGAAHGGLHPVLDAAGPDVPGSQPLDIAPNDGGSGVGDPTSGSAAH